MHAGINNFGTFGTTPEDKLRLSGDLSDARNVLWVATVGTSTGAGSRPILTADNSLSKGFAGGLPAVAAETTIWKVDRTADAITPVWINPDGTSVPLTVFTIEETITFTQHLLFLTKDYAAFCGAFPCPNPPYTGIATLTFEPDTAGSGN